MRVIMPDTGSGYGGKHTGEAAIEAARLAKAAGKPVKLVWTREEEFTWAYFRPAGVIEVRSADESGRPSHRMGVSQLQFGHFGNQHTLRCTQLGRSSFTRSKSPLRQGSYRGLAATANHFARESHMDELAALAGIEPLEFRLRNLKGRSFPRRAQAAADRFGWGNRKPAKALASASPADSKKAATSLPVRRCTASPGRPPRVVRVVESFECGAVVNPDQLKNQMEGAVIQGLGGALFESIDFEDGKILNPRFSQYRVPRFRDAPSIEIVLVDRKDLPPAGAGETPIVTMAPAIANAIFAATGERIRSMPLNAGGPAQPSTGGAAIF